MNEQIQVPAHIVMGPWPIKGQHPLQEAFDALGITSVTVEWSHVGEPGWRLIRDKDASTVTIIPELAEAVWKLWNVLPVDLRLELKTDNES